MGLITVSISPFQLKIFIAVFSSKDAGLRLAMNNSGMIKKDSDWAIYDKYAEQWFPYKTIASIHLWKTVD